MTLMMMQSMARRLSVAWRCATRFSGSVGRVWMFVIWRTHGART